MLNNLPAAVAASVRRALATVAEADARWQVVVALDATLASGTRYQDESREKFAAETAGARSTLTTFRSICSTKGLDAETLLSELSKEAWMSAPARPIYSLVHNPRLASLGFQAYAAIADSGVTTYVLGGSAVLAQGATEAETRAAAEVEIDRRLAAYPALQEEGRKALSSMRAEGARQAAFRKALAGYRGR